MAAVERLYNHTNEHGVSTVVKKIIPGEMDRPNFIVQIGSPDHGVYLFLYFHTMDKAMDFVKAAYHAHNKG